jgi:putative heme-binding domain-containing protein
MSRRLVASGAQGKQWLLETILQPSRDMAPQFTPWQIVTKDGKQHIGLPRRKGGNSEAYLGTDGREFTLKNAEIVSRHEAMVSIMPADLLQPLTQQELADLFAFLMAAR